MQNFSCIKKFTHASGREHKSNHAFTLVEMLVVIAIIALVAALLFPAIAGVKERASTAKCVNNMRQIATALQLAASEDMKLPVHRDTSQPAGQWAWIYRLVDVGFVPNHGSVGAITSNEKIFHCPSDRPTGGPASRQSYALNNLISSGGGVWAKYRNLLNIQKSSDTILLAEVHGNRDNSSYTNVSRNDWDGTNTSKAAFIRHDGKANYAFIDGHVESLTFEETYNTSENIDRWTPDE